MRSKPQNICVVCGSQGRQVYRDLPDRIFGAPGFWSIARCGNVQCRTLWLDPTPEPEDLGLAYSSYFTHADTGTPKQSALKRCYLKYRYGPAGTAGMADLIGAALFSLRFRRRMDVDDQAARLRIPHEGARFLDVGCGKGDAMRLLASVGWQTEGVEFDPDAVAIARARGLNVHQGELDGQRFAEGTFDAVQLSHVIEHLPDPLATIRECHRILRKGGTLVMFTPNADGLTHKLFGVDWMALDPPRHINIFTPASMVEMLGKAGFDAPDVTTSAVGSDRISATSLMIRADGHAAGGERPSWLQKRLSRLIHAAEALTTLVAPRLGDELVVRAVKSTD